VSSVLVDSSVLLDVLTVDRSWGKRSAAAGEAWLIVP
jgi:hypothetical protein